jgi:AhpD family alkylhydroperoxidase
MSDAMYPATTREAAQTRRESSPATEEALQAFSQKVFAEGALSIRMKQLIAVAVAHVTQCPYCIKGHTKAALRHGASREELMEAIWVAAEMRAGGAYAHAILAIQEMDKAAAVGHRARSAPAKLAKDSRCKFSIRERLTIGPGPKSCDDVREALTGEPAGRPLSRDFGKAGAPALLRKAKGGDTRKSPNLCP